MGATERSCTHYKCAIEEDDQAAESTVGGESPQGGLELTQCCMSARLGGVASGETTSGEAPWGSVGSGPNTGLSVIVIPRTLR